MMISFVVLGSNPTFPCPKIYLYSEFKGWYQLETYQPLAQVATHFSWVKSIFKFQQRAQ